MRILAIDTALGLCSAGVFEGDANTMLSVESVDMVRGHAEALMPLIERVMGRVQGGFSSLDRIAVSVGPGSFTGLRVGLAAGRAIGFAAEKPVIGINTLSVFAGSALGKGGHEAVVSVIDARHSHVYLQMIGSEGSLLLAPQIIAIADAVTAIGSMPVRVVGSAASLLASALSEAGGSYVAEPDVAGPDIAWIARLGSVGDPQQSPPSPLYLRPPDATPQTNGRIALV